MWFSSSEGYNCKLLQDFALCGRGVVMATGAAQRRAGSGGNVPRGVASSSYGLLGAVGGRGVMVQGLVYSGLHQGKLP